MKKIILAFSAFLIPHLAQATDHITVACPAEFPLKDANNKSLPLTGMDVWDGISLQEPDIEGGATNSISGDGHWEIHCHYGKGEKDRYQVTIGVPKGSRYCTGTVPARGRAKMFCMGPKEAVPATPPPMFVAQPVDYTAALQGFGLRKTVDEILAEAQRQGLTAMIRVESLSNGGQRTRIDVAPPNHVTIWLSPQTKLSVEVRQDFPKQTDGQSESSATIGFHLFGDFDDVDISAGGLIWDRNLGVVAVTENWRAFPQDNYIRLIDDAQISKESGQPLGHKKYMP